MTRRLTVAALVLGLFAAVAPVRAADEAAAKIAAPAANPPATAQPQRQPLIQIAILLDTSNSMDGLIAQAKTHLWKIVNEFATAKQAGVRPQLQVALFEYGNDGLPSGEGHVRKVLDLTTDLDKVSEELFALRTNGGSEYCGWVIRDAVKALSWSVDPKDFRAIFIAGNEPFTQGPVAYVESCKTAIAKGIVVNTIHCGPRQVGVDTKWEHGAQLADGAYNFIDQNIQVVQITAPQDAEIVKLNGQLNGTYVFYGKKGEEAKNRQEQQDAAASSVGGAPVLSQRAASKASALYRNADVDLIDAIDTKKVKLEDVKEADLPEDVRKLKPEERDAYIAKKAAERREVQAKIKELTEARNKYVAEEMKKQSAEKGDATLDEAIVKTVREQAQKRDFKFDSK